MKPFLTVLTPTLKDREHLLNQLYLVLLSQCKEYNVKVITDDHATDSVGVKRARLAKLCKTEYAVYIDDDDMISGNYMELVHAGLKQDVDVVEMRGVITVGGKQQGTFNHSIRFDKWEDGKIYTRPPNHLNPMRTKYFKEYPFPDLRHAEDFSQSMAMSNAGLWKGKTEHSISEILYHYRYVNRK